VSDGVKNEVSQVVESAVAYRIGIASIILVIVFIVGSVGFHLLEDMTLFEGFYMTFITISTIGFSELKSLSPAGRIFTMIVFVMGIGVISYIASQTTQLLFESELFIKRAMKQELKKIQDHYIIAGYGRIGHRIADVLKNAELPVVIVENSEEKIERINNDGFIYVEGNAQEEYVLKSAGIDRAKALICTLSSDQDNVFVTLIARELREDLFILVRTNQHSNRRKILRAGADKVISPYEIGADRMANVILRPNVNQFIEQFQKNTSDDHAFDEVKVFEGSEMADKTLMELGVRGKFEILIIAVLSAETGQMIFNPGSNQKINEGDSLIVLGDIKTIEKFRKEVCRDHRSIAERSENPIEIKV
jgi:voltage-gated potassium channel